MAAGAASVRVSNELGAGRPSAARLAAQSAAVLALTLMACIAILLASLHRLLPLIITSDPAVIDGTQRVIPIVAYMLIGDGMNAVLAGVVRGCGQQAKGRVLCGAMTVLCGRASAFDKSASQLLDPIFPFGIWLVLVVILTLVTPSNAH